ncbi:hypothetical protein LNQ03_04035 [Klebsiella pneumoniae subsp. pneumoniae]|nr:hypothetical protein [Klebsiella pneumoniae subsp. pneumoniae]
MNLKLRRTRALVKKQHNYTVMHWGTWQVESREGEIVAVKPVPRDKNPSRIGQSLPRRGDQPNAHSPSGGARRLSPARAGVTRRAR